MDEVGGAETGHIVAGEVAGHEEVYCAHDLSLKTFESGTQFQVVGGVTGNFVAPVVRPLDLQGDGKGKEGRG